MDTADVVILEVSIDEPVRVDAVLVLEISVVVSIVLSLMSESVLVLVVTVDDEIIEFSINTSDVDEVFIEELL